MFCNNFSWMNMFSSFGYGGYGMGGGGLLEQMLAMKMLREMMGGEGCEEHDHDLDESQRRPRRESDRLIDNRIDLDGNGKYKKGNDGILIFDFGNDGVSEEDIAKSKRLMQYLNDGEGGEIPAELKTMDGNDDGKLDEGELKAAHAQVWTDRNKDGRYDRGERFEVGVDSIESRAGKFVLKSLNLRTGATNVEVDLG